MSTVEKGHPYACDRCGVSLDVVMAEEINFGEHVCERVAMRAWHTEACAALLEDPGEVCICRPPRGDDNRIDFNRKGAAAKVSSPESQRGASVPHPSRGTP